jgi:hypothetical protein
MPGDDRVREIPGQDQQIVRITAIEFDRREHWDVVAGGEKTLLQGAVVDDEVEDLLTQLKVMEKSGRLGRRSKARDVRLSGHRS